MIVHLSLQPILISHSLEYAQVDPTEVVIDVFIPFVRVYCRPDLDMGDNNKVNIMSYLDDKSLLSLERATVRSNIKDLVQEYASRRLSVCFRI